MNKNNNTHNKKTVKHIAGVILAALFLFPAVASAQFVPVQDFKLIADFAAYVAKFTAYQAAFTNFSNNFTAYSNMWRQVMVTNTDSVRQMLAGNPDTEKLYLPQSGTTKEIGYGNANGNIAPAPAKKCTTRKTVDEPWAWPANVPPTPDSPWTRAVVGGAIPYDSYDGVNGTKISNAPIMVNSSVSLSCLLQELVEWNKLSLYLQIHDLLLKYISNAQAAQLAHKLSGVLSAADLDYTKQANQYCTTDPVTGIKTCNNFSGASERPQEVTAHVAKLREDNTLRCIAGDPACVQGAVDTAFPGLAAAIANNSDTNSAVDPIEKVGDLNQSLYSISNPASAPFANQASVQSFFLGAANTVDQQDGGVIGGLFSTMGTANNPAYALSKAYDLTTSGNQFAAAEMDKRRTSSGIQGDTACGGDLGCDLSQQVITTPAATRENNVTHDATVGRDVAMNTDSLDAMGGRALVDQQSGINKSGVGGGVNGYDTSALKATSPEEYKLVAEFYDTINWGYFDSQYDVRRWAQAAMLSIYDQMPYSTDYISQGVYMVPNAVTTNNGSDELYFDP